MLENYNAKNYEYNGAKMTEYEAWQKQRYIGQTRRWKREEGAMKATGLPTDEAKSKIARWNDTQRDFIKQTGLKRQPDREMVAKFGKSEAQKVVQAQKKTIKDYAQQHISSVNSANNKGNILKNDANSDIVNETAKRFSNRDDADKLFRPWAEKAWKLLSPEEKDAAFKYTMGSDPFNRPLRGYDKSWSNFVGIGKVPLNNEGAEKWIIALKDGLNKVELQEDVWLFRGSDQQSLAGLLGIDKSKIIPSKVDALNRKFAGQTIQDNAFISTGIAADAGFKKQISYEILSPKGTKGIYAEPFSFFGGTNTQGTWDGKYKGKTVESEAEVILQAGTKFEINEIKLISGKITVVLKILKNN